MARYSITLSRSVKRKDIQQMQSVHDEITGTKPAEGDNVFLKDLTRSRIKLKNVLYNDGNAIGVQSEEKKKTLLKAVGQALGFKKEFNIAERFKGVHQGLFAAGLEDAKSHFKFKAGKELKEPFFHSENKLRNMDFHFSNDAKEAVVVLSISAPAYMMIIDNQYYGVKNGKLMASTSMLDFQPPEGEEDFSSFYKKQGFEPIITIHTKTEMRISLKDENKQKVKTTFEYDLNPAIPSLIYTGPKRTFFTPGLSVKIDKEGPGMLQGIKDFFSSLFQTKSNTSKVGFVENKVNSEVPIVSVVGEAKIAIDNVETAASASSIKFHTTSPVVPPVLHSDPLNESESEREIGDSPKVTIHIPGLGGSDIKSPNYKH
jgi:hypothetical protein